MPPLRLAVALLHERCAALAADLLAAGVSIPADVTALKACATSRWTRATAPRHARSGTRPGRANSPSCSPAGVQARLEQPEITADPAVDTAP